MRSKRLSSVDAFRGLTIAAMILVNNPASWKYVYPPLRHAEWHGWTPTDFIFPFFLFIVGISISLAFSRRREQGSGESSLYAKVVKRAFIIFTAGAALLALGVCLALIDGLGYKKWAYPFLVLGTNAITVFVGSAL